MDPLTENLSLRQKVTELENEVSSLKNLLNNYKSKQETFEDKVKCLESVVGNLRRLNSPRKERNFQERKEVEILNKKDKSETNKEVACNVVNLPSETVVFKDISPDLLTGEVTEVIEKSGSHSSDALPGKIQVQLNNDVIYYPYGEHDLKAEYTLRIGDWVQFNVATDLRDNLQRATNIELLINEFTFSKEKREQGFVTSLNLAFGFISYGVRENQAYFRLSELLNPEDGIKLQDEVEFTTAQDPASPDRIHALRIKVLPPGTTNSSSKQDQRKSDVGMVDKEAPSRSSLESPQRGGKKSAQEENDDEMSGEDVITLNKNKAKESLYFTTQDSEHRSFPRAGNKLAPSNINPNGSQMNARMPINQQPVQQNTAPAAQAPANNNGMVHSQNMNAQSNSARLNHLEAARQQNLLKIQQLQQTLEAAQQKELLYKTAQAAQEQQQVQQQVQQQQQQQHQQQQMIDRQNAIRQLQQQLQLQQQQLAQQQQTINMQQMNQLGNHNPQLRNLLQQKEQEYRRSCMSMFDGSHLTLNPPTSSAGSLRPQPTTAINRRTANDSPSERLENLERNRVESLEKIRFLQEQLTRAQNKEHEYRRSCMSMFDGSHLTLNPPTSSAGLLRPQPTTAINRQTVNDSPSEVFFPSMTRNHIDNYENHNDLQEDGTSTMPESHI